MSAEIIPFVKEPADPKCSFCKTPKSKVKSMMASPRGHHICGACAKRCKELIEAHNNENI